MVRRVHRFSLTRIVIDTILIGGGIRYWRQDPGMWLLAVGGKTPSFVTMRLRQAWGQEGKRQEQSLTATTDTMAGDEPGWGVRAWARHRLGDEEGGTAEWHLALANSQRGGDPRLVTSLEALIALFLGVPRDHPPLRSFQEKPWLTS